MKPRKSRLTSMQQDKPTVPASQSADEVSFEEYVRIASQGTGKWGPPQKRKK